MVKEYLNPFKDRHVNVLKFSGSMETAVKYILKSVREEYTKQFYNKAPCNSSNAKMNELIQDYINYASKHEREDVEIFDDFDPGEDIIVERAKKVTIGKSFKGNEEKSAKKERIAKTKQAIEKIQKQNKSAYEIVSEEPTLLSQLKNLQGYINLHNDQRISLAEYQGQLKDKNCFILGPGGIGKSRFVRDCGKSFGYTIIPKSSDRWFSNPYNPQDDVLNLVDDCNEQFLGANRNFIKIWVDRYSCSIEQKGFNLLLNPKQLWVFTSNLTYDEIMSCMRNLTTEQQAFQRRFTWICVDNSVEEREDDNTNIWLCKEENLYKYILKWFERTRQGRITDYWVEAWNKLIETMFNKSSFSLNDKGNDILIKVAALGVTYDFMPGALFAALKSEQLYTCNMNDYYEIVKLFETKKAKNIMINYLIYYRQVDLSKQYDFLCVNRKNVHILFKTIITYFWTGAKQEEMIKNMRELIKLRVDTKDENVEFLFSYGWQDDNEKFVTIMCDYIQQLSNEIGVDPITITREFRKFDQIGKDLDFKYEAREHINEIPSWFSISNE